MNKEVLDYFNGDELAAGVWQSKYRADEETTPVDSFRRCAAEFVRVRNLYKSELPLTVDSLTDIFAKNMICLAGSVLANLGNKNYIGSLSNCFVAGQPHDSYSGIMEKDEQLVQLMKRRGGVGLDISTLRPSNAPVNNAAKTSTGAVTFAHRYSNSTNEVAQNGRRGALMLSIDCRHPNVLDFIESKQDLTKLTGANISVGIRDDFMTAVEHDEEYLLQWPVYSDDPTITKKVKAQEIWDRLITCAHKTGEPGIIFLDRHWDFSPDTCYPEHRGVTTNPCGEIFMSAHDTCRLIHINILKFVDEPYTDKAKFNFEHFHAYCHLMMTLADDLVNLELEAIERIIDHIKETYTEVNQRELDLWLKVKDKTIRGRRAGCGSLGWADAVAAMGMKYDSDEALKLIEEIARTKYDAELEATIAMAKTRGAFPDYDEDLDILPKRRNISWSTVAPTGTTSILAQVSSGIEPLFATCYTRNVKTNEGEAYDFTDAVGVKFKKHVVYHPQVKQWMEMHDDLTIEDSPWFDCTADKIDWKRRIEIQAAIQRHTTHSISSTINLPKDTPKELVSEIYFEAWKYGLKGITVYVDGSRSGILVTEDNQKENFRISHAPKRPRELDATFYFVMVNGSKFGVIIGLYDGRPYEVFALKLNEKYKDRVGKLIKINKGRYDFVSSNLTIENINITSEQEKAVTIMASLALRHGADIPVIVKTLMKTSTGVTDFSSAVCRILKKYLKEGQALLEICSDCGEKMIFENGCARCPFCGLSKCG